MRWIVLGLAMVGTPAMAAEQFDLVCKSTTSTNRYRVDLRSGEACVDQCDRVWKMGTTSSGELRIIDKQPVLRGDLRETMVVNRQSGDFEYWNSLGGRGRGKCEAVAFSGFPAAKF